MAWLFEDYCGKLPGVAKVFGCSPGLFLLKSATQEKLDSTAGFWFIKNQNFAIWRYLLLSI
jgi:hypothetical protein